MPCRVAVCCAIQLKNGHILRESFGRLLRTQIYYCELLVTSVNVSQASTM